MERHELGQAAAGRSVAGRLSAADTPAAQADTDTSVAGRCL